MASLLPANVAIPVPIADTLSAFISQKSAFAASAAAGANFNAGAQMGGNFFSLGRWKEDTTAAEVIDGSASTPGAVASYADIAPILRRKRVRGIVDGVDAALGQQISVNPTQAILEQAAAYWAREIDNTFVQSLTGLFDGSSGVLRTTHRSPMGVASGTPVPASFSLLVDAGTALGDNFNDLAILVCHSKVWANLQKEAGSKATYIPMGNVLVPVYNGMRVILSDFVPTSGSSTFKKYTSIMLRPGALYLAVQREMREIVEINATVPEVRITQTMHWACAMRGIKWNVTTANPADSDLYTPGNWAKASAVDKEIGIVALETNAT